MEKRRCIFHVPNSIDINRKSGSNIRPFKMIEAFKNIGYQVDIVMGYGKERKENIKNGIKYDFLYSESSTMPTLLTEKNHLPLYPFLDFGFFKFCKKHSIKIGLFYRDMHWKFDIYTKVLPWYKKIITIPMYKYDLIQYKKYVDIIYLASEKVKKYMPDFDNIEILPPGVEEDKEILKNKIKFYEDNINNNSLNIFYVGGISKELYYFKELLEVVKNKENIKLTICCREKEWENNKEDYSEFLNENIFIVHEGGEKLKEFYAKADICSLFLRPTEYMSIAAPVKMFEYLGNITPMIAINNTVAGDFVNNNNCGWTIEYDKKELDNLLSDLLKNKEQILKKAKNMEKVLSLNTWNERAKKVEKNLKN